MNNRLPRRNLRTTSLRNFSLVLLSTMSVVRSFGSGSVAD